MDIYTMNYDYTKRAEIEAFESAIWTDRYGGDGEVQIKVEIDPAVLGLLPTGSLLGLTTSDSPMVIESHSIESGLCTVAGISLPKWLDNRQIRTDPQPWVKTYDVTDVTPDELIRTVVAIMCTPEGASQYLNDDYHAGDPFTYPSMGMPGASRFIVPGLTAENHVGVSLGTIDYQVPFGGVYSSIKDLADTFALGLRINRVANGDGTFRIVFSVYTGLDRTSDQTTRPVIRFSPLMESLDNIKELYSIEADRNLIYGFAPGVDSAWTEAGGPGIQDNSSGATGFDLRVDQIWSETITQQQIDALSWPAVGGPIPVYLTLINHEIAVYAKDHRAVSLVDGEIAPDIDIDYGTDYSLGDVVEFQGASGAITPGFVTEYIQSQDSAGAKSYPTISMPT